MNTQNERKTIYHDFEPKCDYLSARFDDDSMRNAGIFNGSIVVLHKQRTANDGDIIAALLGKKLYLRRYKQYGKTIMLLPENSAYDPIPVVNKDDFLVLGKVVQVCTFLD